MHGSVSLEDVESTLDIDEIPTTSAAVYEPRRARDGCSGALRPSVTSHSGMDSPKSSRWMAGASNGF